MQAFRAATVGLGAMIATPVQAQSSPQASPAQTRPATGSATQQAFEAASKLDTTGTPAARVAAWSAIEARVRGNKRSVAIMRIRKGAALRDLDQGDAAEAALRAGLADLPATDPSLADDRYLGWLELALLQEAALDYASAAQSFATAETASTSNADRMQALIGRIRTATYVDPDAALAALGRADALIAQAGADKPVKGLVRRWAAELRLNRGDIAGARADAAAAVELFGGLTEATDLNDVPVRSDYALASLLAGKTDDARRYMAMTGAGRTTKGDFNPALEMTVPDCGGEDRLKPDDMAVVEFSVGDDGAVTSVRPVYAAGGGGVALAFARSVQDWSWSPDKLAKMPVFFRNRARVELRCSTAFQRPSVQAFLDDRQAHWLEDKGVPPLPALTGSEVAAVRSEREALAAAERAAGPDSLLLVPHLHRLAGNRLLARDERQALLIRELALLDRAGATGTPRLAAEAPLWASATEQPGRYFRDVVPALIEAHYGRDPEARAAARMLVADALSKPGAVRPWLTQVTGDAALAEDSPVKVAAHVRLASLEQQAGNADAARAAFEASHLSADQCALIDSPPAMLRNGGVFPQEAMQWGFEGWNQVQYDITADGHAINARAVVAYPPFVFDKAGLTTFTHAQFAKSFRPQGGLGCGGQTGRVRFRIPS